MSYNKEAEVVTVQPGHQGGAAVSGGQWMQAPSIPSNCPPGLEYLTQIDQLLCHQIVELLQAFTGWETNNKYVIKNSMGQQIYYVFEDTDLCMRLFCKQGRSFTLHVVDNYQREVLQIIRPFACCAGCCWCAGCCNFEVEVQAPPGQTIGRVKQIGGACSLRYMICDANGNEQLKIDGPCCLMHLKCCSDVKFPITNLDGSRELGTVSKQWSGLAKELFTNATNFGMTFPMDLDVRTKATLVGAMFLIDFNAFEQQNNNNN